MAALESDTQRYLRPRWFSAMGAALASAAQAVGGDDVPVGAVVVAADDTILSRAHNVREREADPTGHAEVVALRAAAAALGRWRLTGCTLVVTLEPCVMCAGAAVAARVDRVVYGTADPKAGAAGSVWDLLRDTRANHRPEVISGVLAEQCQAQLQDFFSVTRDGDGASPAARPSQDR
jgi:tRNA(adenine34) deaminase